jgi:hypothetical protein
MTTIKTTCDQCGEIHLGTSDIALELEGRGDEGTYRFVCPECFIIQRRPASRRVVSVLLATGVSYEVTLAPAGPITESELARFIQNLDTDDWFERLVTYGDSAEPSPST